LVVFVYLYPAPLNLKAYARQSLRNLLGGAFYQPGNHRRRYYLYFPIGIVIAGEFLFEVSIAGSNAIYQINQ